MPDRQSLVSRYGLTVGEAALAMKLAAGKSLQEAAEELLISDQAARMRLQRILMKSEEQDRSPFIMKLSLTRL
jgi:DNA-binding CsgD family transcriptional regulator